MNLQAEASSLKKGETLLDTAYNLNAMKPDCFVMRHSASGAPNYVARHLDIPVVNAGTARMSILRRACLMRLRFAIARNHQQSERDDPRDIQHSRVARSNIHLLGKFRLPLYALRPVHVGSPRARKNRTGHANSLRVSD